MIAISDASLKVLPPGSDFHFTMYNPDVKMRPELKILDCLA